MIVYQGSIQVKSKPKILLLEFIGSWVCIIILFNLYTIVMSVVNLNILDKKIKDSYNYYHYLNRDGKIFLLIIYNYCLPAYNVVTY